MSAIIFSRNVLFKVYGIVVFTENIQTILNADLLVFEFFLLVQIVVSFSRKYGIVSLAENINSKMCIVALGRKSKITIKLRQKYNILIVHDS